MGSVYKRGAVFWIQYYRNGKPYRESTKSKKEADAKKLLKLREGEISQGKLPGFYFDKVRFDELAEGLIRDYKLNGKKSIDRVKQALIHLKKTFRDVRVTDITTPKIEKYVEKRLDEGAANATINRELSALRRMLNIGAKQHPPKVNRVPFIPLLKENNVKKGFFEHAQFLALRDALPSHLKGFVTFAYKTGWRLSEATSVRFSQVDLTQGIVRLDPGETKNDEGRMVYLDDELKEIFHNQYQNRKSLLPYVFLNENDSDKIKCFRKTWNKACREIGLGYGYKVTTKYVDKWQGKLPAGPTIHDFRRSACRNMIRSGIPQQVAKMLSGHKTDSVFNRYNIVSEEDLKLAAQRQEAYLQTQREAISTTIHQLDTKKEVAFDR
jgi:integrase